MGRIRSTWVKTIAEELFVKYPDKLSASFDGNKVFITSLKLIESKNIRNKVAGYVVKVATRKKL